MPQVDQSEEIRPHQKLIINQVYIEQKVQKQILTRTIFTISINPTRSDLNPVIMAYKTVAKKVM